MLYYLVTAFEIIFLTFPPYSYFQVMCLFHSMWYTYFLMGTHLAWSSFGSVNSFQLMSKGFSIVHSLI